MQDMIYSRGDNVEYVEVLNLSFGLYAIRRATWHRMTISEPEYIIPINFMVLVSVFVLVVMFFFIYMSIKTYINIIYE